MSKLEIFLWVLVVVVLLYLLIRFVRWLLRNDATWPDVVETTYNDGSEDSGFWANLFSGNDTPSDHEFGGGKSGGGGSESSWGETGKENYFGDNSYTPSDDWFGDDD